MKKKSKASMRVIIRHQTNEENRQFRQSLSLLLAEIARQHISGLRRGHEHSK